MYLCGKPVVVEHRNQPLCLKPGVQELQMTISTDAPNTFKTNSNTNETKSSNHFAEKHSTQSAALKLTDPFLLCFNSTGRVCKNPNTISVRYDQDPRQTEQYQQLTPSYTTISGNRSQALTTFTLTSRLQGQQIFTQTSTATTST